MPSLNYLVSVFEEDSYDDKGIRHCVDNSAPALIQERDNLGLALWGEVPTVFQ
jgi:hypothetical protein